MLYQISTKQLIKSNLNTVWDFISSPKNLSLITPSYMNFEILSISGGEKMHSGQLIEYKVRPLLNIPMYWVTEITHVKELEYFVDEQRFGPYSFWHHKHFIKETTEGIEMIDSVHYKVPMGFIGDIGNAVFIKKQLSGIFDYRFRKINELFNQ